MRLPLLGSGTYGQIFTPRVDGVQLTTGTVTNVLGMWCHADGVVTATYASGDEKTITLEAGDQWGFLQAASVAITSGTWSFM